MPLAAPYGTGKDALFKPLNDEDVKFYTGKVKESKKRVDKIGGYLEKKQWEEVRSELTRQVYDLRRSGQKLADAKQTPQARESLKALFQNIEDLTVASRRKQVRALPCRGGGVVGACLFVCVIRVLVLLCVPSVRRRRETG